ELVADKAVLVTITGLNNTQYYAPTIFPSSNPAATCGGSGTRVCDQIPEVQAALAAVECNGPYPCMNIDTSKVYFTGSSSGAVLPESVMCDERTSTDGHGYGIDSNTLFSPGRTS